MKRCWIAALTALLAASACGTRVPAEERAARRAALTGSGVVEPADPAALTPGVDAATTSDPSADQSGAGPATMAGPVAPGGAVGRSGTPGAGSGLPAGGGGSASSPAGGAADVSGPRVTGPSGMPAGVSDPGVTDTEIRIGASVPLSGIVGFAGEEMVGAIDAYFQTINARGGVQGRKLRLLAYDDRLDSSQTLANVRRLYEVDKVVGLYLAFGDSAADYVTRNGIPTLVLGITHTSFSSRHPTMFPIIGNVLLWTQQWVMAAKSTGLFKPGLRVAVLYDSQFLPIGSYIPFIKASWENGGAKVVSTDPFNLTDGDCTSLVLKMRQLQVDWWDFQALGWVLCASAAARQQYRPAVGWGGWPTSVAGLASQVGPWVEGMWGAGIGDHTDGRPRTKTAAHDEYANAIRTYHPRLSSVDHLESPVTIFGWMGAKVLAAAIAAQGRTVTKAGINQWISGAENFDPGIAPPIGSMAPNCKTASEVAWFGRWHWDADKRQAVRVPETGYYPSDQKDRFGGRCFLTKIADSFD